MIKNLETRMKVQRLLETSSSDIPDSLLEAAGEVLFSYPVVIVMTDAAVPAGEELRVTYIAIRARTSPRVVMRCGLLARDIALPSACVSLVDVLLT